MRYLEKLGLGAVAALCLLAFTGVGTASATLYTDSGKTVSYPVGTTFHSKLVVGTTSKYKSGGTTIGTCTELETHGKSTTWWILVTTDYDTYDYTNCAQTTDTISNGSLSIATNGEVTSSGNQVTFGVFGTSCTYGTGEGTKLGTLTSGVTPLLKINTTIPRIAGGFLCPTPVTWEAELVMESPHAVYVG